ncbi:fimbrial protein (plasmid) [Serratia sp. JSRIV002]|uniref:CS1 type fimbrial major subunit n=1 Tax=Serratia sp. JSRIV002 TaxID=2831894 RepID=UPI001CBDE22A|nr:CS1 type fimbrial major subunit [Serratia sp. JSRIV002]UAN54640.1 fimbrial protein [Serratia sp. JSRIV002]
MKSNFKIALGAAALIAAFSASAVQRDITVTASIDPSIEVTKADGSPLPAAVEMQYLPGKGLQPYQQQIKFWSNMEDRALNVSLASEPSLIDRAGANPIPLSISVNGQTLTTSATSFAYATTFPGGLTNGSSAMPLVIAQKTPGVITSPAGTYSGIVSLVVTQATAPAGQ